MRVDVHEAMRVDAHKIELLPMEFPRIVIRLRDAAIQLATAQLATAQLAIASITTMRRKRMVAQPAAAFDGGGGEM
ncbi:MAG TPA: hypothetical protein VIT65_12670 [Microlunatus sp.]